MRITFDLLKEMEKLCRQEGCRLLVVIIPTKETVFSEYLEKEPRPHLHEALDRVIVNERFAKKTLLESRRRGDCAFGYAPGLETVGWKAALCTNHQRHASGEKWL